MEVPDEVITVNFRAQLGAVCVAIFLGLLLLVLAAAASGALAPVN
jgi:hypothetical protein